MVNIISFSIRNNSTSTVTIEKPNDGGTDNLSASSTNTYTVTGTYSVGGASSYATISFQSGTFSISGSGTGTALVIAATTS